MNTRKLGKTGYEVSEIGLGCWQLGGDFGPVADDTASEILRTARSLDVNFWDTADVYGGGQSESRIGGFKDKKGVLVATKLGRGAQFEGMTRYTKDRVKESLAGSIKRLGVETLDLAQLHCIPIDVLRDGEIFAWLDDMRDAGMIRHWGASVQTVEEGMLAMRASTCTTLQTIFNLFRQDAVDSLLPGRAEEQCRDHRAAAARVRPAVGQDEQDHGFRAAGSPTLQPRRPAFLCRRDVLGPAVREGRRVRRRDQALAAGRDEPRRSRAALDPRPAGGVDDHRGRHRLAQLTRQCAASRMDPLDPRLVEKLKDFYVEKVRPEVRGGSVGRATA